MHNLLAFFLSAFFFICLDSGSFAQAQPKPLAPGVLKVIPHDIVVRDTHSLPLPLDGLESQAYNPKTAPISKTLNGQTQNVIFYRDVWGYEFAFTGLRQLTIELPQVNGEFKPENVWYIVYRIRNTGANATYDRVEDQQSGQIDHVLKTNDPNYEIKGRFLPHFYLTGWVKEPGDEAAYQRVRYLDCQDRIALTRIREAEDRDRVLIDKTEMMNFRFPVVKSVADDGIWGGALWRGVDPRLDYAAVQITGLTNAYRIENLSDGQRNFRYRTLQLNFWRPGDQIRQSEDRISYGIPLVDDPIRQIEICQRYQLPGPLIRGYIDSPRADQPVLAVEMDAQIQFSDFSSKITPDLDEGTVPELIRDEFRKAGVEIAAGAQVDVSVPEKKWLVVGQVSGEQRQLTIQLEPQYWEKDGDGIRFIRSLDHLWIYR